MSKTFFHNISMSAMPHSIGAYLYALDHEEITWSQEGSWLLLFADHVGIMTVGARTQVYQKWAVFVIPPGYRCRLKRSSEEMSCAFWGRFIPEVSGMPMLAVPGFVQLGEFGPLWNQRLRVALNRAYQMQREMQIVISDLLWSIGVDPGLVRQRTELKAAEQLVEDLLGQRIQVEDLARQVGLSHNQLIRLFREEHGVSPLEYIRQRRQNFACRLLLETSLPVKQVAASVGISDLAQFNRLVKSASGLSPRDLRASIRPANLFRT